MGMGIRSSVRIHLLSEKKGTHAQRTRRRLVVLAVPLILSPRLLLFLSETGTERRVALTPLESFMAFHTGILVFAIALALIFNVSSYITYF